MLRFNRKYLIHKSYICPRKKEKVMAREMYSYTLMVLEKVSFDLDLFTAELKKATEILLPYELDELKLWVNAFVFNNPHLEKSRVVLAS